MRKLLTIALLLFAGISAAQVTTPTIRIKESFPEKVEVSLCNNDSVMVFSFYSFYNSVCVRQEIAFLDSSPEWVSGFAMDHMGFIPGDSSLIKKIPTGFLSASVKESVVSYHGEQQATSLVIELYEWAEEEEE